MIQVLVLHGTIVNRGASRLLSHGNALIAGGSGWARLNLSRNPTIEITIETARDMHELIALRGTRYDIVVFDTSFTPTDAVREFINAHLVKPSTP